MKSTRLVAFLLAFWLHHVHGAAPAPRPLPGWTMRLVLEAPAIRHPSVACVAPDGRVFVAEDPMDISSPNAHLPEGRIICLHPDGHTTVFADRLYAVFGMQYLEGKLYVLHNPRFSVFTDDQGVGRDRKELIEQTNPEPWALDWNDHVPANFRLAMDGYFYVATGDKGLYGAVDRSGQRVDLHGGGVFRIRPDGTGLEVFSTGVRNILDVSINDEDELFTYDNTDEHDWMGRLTHMVDGGFYGYPFDFVPRRPYTLWMLADYGPGAATGALAWNNASLSPAYRSNLILADFGQRNLRRVRLERGGATYRAVENELLFPDPPPDFRPVGITETPDGSGFYICDWQHADNKESVTVGRLWLLTADFATNGLPRPERYAPVLAAALGKPAESSIANLLEGLSHPQKWMRLAAQRALSRRGPEAAPALVKVLEDDKDSVTTRAHALWALDAIDGGAAARTGISSLAGASPERVDASLIRQAIRQLGQRAGPEVLPIFTAQSKSTDASIRLQAANAMRRVNHAAAVPALIEGLSDPDLFARHAVFTALNRLGRAHSTAWPIIVKALDRSVPEAREAASFALRDTYDADLAQVLANAARDSSSPVSTRAMALLLLAGIHQQPPAWKGEWWAYHPALGQPPAKPVKWEGTEVVTRALRAGLEDGEAVVRLAAVNGLRAVNESESAPRLRARFAQESSPDVRRAILETLGDLGDLDALPIVMAALLARPLDAALLPAALVAAGKLGGATNAPAEALPPLALGLTNLPPAALNTTELRVAALEALGRLRRADSTSWLAWRAASDGAPERAAALEALVRLGGGEALAALRSLSGSGSPEARRAAVTAMGRLKSRAAADDLLTAYRDDITREVAIAALTELPDLRALDAYLSGLASPAVALRDKSRVALAALAKEAWPLIQLRPDRITPMALQELRRVYAKDTNILTSPLFAQATTAPEPVEFERFALANTGDAWRGQKLFFDPQGVACIKCHLVAGWGGTVGPDLTTIGSQFGRAALIESVLYPSKTVREGYQQYIVETTDEESFNGAIKNESAETLTLVDVEGRLHPIPKARIKTRRSSALSLMPEGLHAGLKLEQFADLIAYVESLREDPRRPGTKTPPAGFEPLFNGRDLTGWKASPHWRAREGMLEHDGVADDIWSTRELVDFELHLEWRWPDQPHFEDHPVINAEGYEVKGADGQLVRERVLEAGDSGVFFRGLYKAQANLFCYPIGSGEFWEYRESLAGEERRSVTPSRRTDRPIGQWNDMWITVREDHVTVMLNGQEVIRQAKLPGLPARGPIGFQHEHGRLQLRNIFVRQLAR